jgi:hypothetical protein
MCLGEQLPAGHTLTPGGNPHGDAQRAPLTVYLDLDRVQPAQSTPRDDLSTRLVGAWKQDQQLTGGGVSDTVEAAQLAPKRGGKIGKRLSGQLLAVCACELLDIVDAHKQTAERGAVASGATDLLLQAQRELGGR